MQSYQTSHFHSVELSDNKLLTVQRYQKNHFHSAELSDNILLTVQNYQTINCGQCRTIRQYIVDSAKLSDISFPTVQSYQTQYILQTFCWRSVWQIKPDWSTAFINSRKFKFNHITPPPPGPPLLTAFTQLEISQMLTNYSMNVHLVCTVQVIYMYVPFKQRRAIRQYIFNSAELSDNTF